MRIIGLDNIADVFGVAPKTIVEWQESGFPVLVQGGRGVPNEYDSQPCIRWLVDRDVRKVQAESPKDRLQRLQGDDLEMRLAKSRGELVRADEVEPAMKAAIVSARERIRGEPARIARMIEGKDTAAREAVLREMFDEVLGKLAAWRQAAEIESDERTD